MKEDEIKFFKTMVKYGRRYNGKYMYGIASPREIINILREFMNYKRCWYLLEKWSGLGFYNYGVALDLGWIELNMLPDRYKELLEEDKED